MWREAYERAVAMAARQPDSPGIATDVAISLWLLADGEEDPAPLLAQARSVLEAHRDRLLPNGQRLLALLSGDEGTEP